MRKITIVLLTLLVLGSKAAPAEDERAVLSSVSKLIDAWREADADKAGSVLHPDFRLVSVHHEEKMPKLVPTHGMSYFRS